MCVCQHSRSWGRVVLGWEERLNIEKVRGSHLYSISFMYPTECCPSFQCSLYSWTKKSFPQVPSLFPPPTISHGEQRKSEATKSSLTAGSVVGERESIMNYMCICRCVCVVEYMCVYVYEWLQCVWVIIISIMNDHNLYNTLTAPKPAEMSPICAAWSVQFSMQVTGTVDFIPL